MWFFKATGNNVLKINDIVFWAILKYSLWFVPCLFRLFRKRILIHCRTSFKTSIPSGRVWSRMLLKALALRNSRTTWKVSTLSGIPSTKRLHVFVFFFFRCENIKTWPWPLKQVTSIFTIWSADCWAFSPAARSPLALWPVPGCSGVPTQLVDWHGGARGQSKTSVCRVQSGEGTDTRAEGKPVVQSQIHTKRKHIEVCFNVSTSILHVCLTLAPPLILFNWH